VNNTKYAQMAMNALPDELCTEKGIKDFYINFVHESKPNDKLDIYLGEDMAASEDGRVFYVEGKVEGKTSFLVKIVL
jgi:acyl-ACP thioesterase